MRVLLVHCRFPAHSWEDCVPLGIASIAAYVRAHLASWQVEVLDANCPPADCHEVADVVASRRPDVLGLSLMTPQIEYACRLTSLVKASRHTASTIVVHGGAHPTGDPRQSLRSGADVCVLGEGEQTFAELLQAVHHGQSLHRVRGLAFLSDDSLVRTAPRPLLGHLDPLPACAYDGFPLKRYTQTLHLERGNALPVMGSRGCPHACRFCASALMWKRRVRFTSPTRLADRLAELSRRHGVRRYHFYDDDFLCSGTWARNLCEALIDHRVNVRWVCLVRADSVCRHRGMLPLMREAGCIGVEVGLETIDDRVSAASGKGADAATGEGAVRALREAAMPVAVLELMAMNPGETLDGHRRAAAALRRLIGRDDLFLGHFATPYPGTPFAADAARKGRVLSVGWDRYNSENVVFIPNSLLDESPRKLKPELSELDCMITRLYCHPPGVPLQRRIPQQARVLRVFPLLDGRRTVRALLDEFGHSAGEKCAADLSPAPLARALIVWAQLGAVAGSETPAAPVSAPAESAPGEWYARHRGNLYRHSIRWPLTGEDRCRPSRRTSRSAC